VHPTLRQNRAANPFLNIPPSRISKAKRRPSQVEAALCKASFSIDFVYLNLLRFNSLRFNPLRFNPLQTFLPDQMRRIDSSHLASLNAA